MLSPTPLPQINPCQTRAPNIVSLLSPVDEHLIEAPQWVSLPAPWSTSLPLGLLPQTHNCIVLELSARPDPARNIYLHPPASTQISNEGDFRTLPCTLLPPRCLPRRLSRLN